MEKDMSEKKKKAAEISVTTATYLMGTVDLPAGKYSKARLLDIILGFDAKVDTDIEPAEAQQPPAPKTTPPAPVLGEPTPAENKALMLWSWVPNTMPVGVPCLRLMFAVFAWIRAEPGRMAEAIAALHTDGKVPKLKKSLADFSDFIGHKPVSDSARWLFSVIHTNEVTSVKAVYEALAQINSEHLVADLWKWGLSYVSVIHNTDAALAAAANPKIIEICRGEAVDKAYAEGVFDQDVNMVVKRIERAAEDTVQTLMTQSIKGSDLKTAAAPAPVVVEEAKTPDAVVEPLGYGPPGDDLVATGDVLSREDDVQRDVTPPKEKLKGSASSIMKALRDAFNKLGGIKTVELANRMSQLPPDKSLGAVVKLMGMVNCADEAELLTEMVNGDYVSISDIESVFRDEWQPLYTSLVAGLRTTGPIPPWINGGLLAQKTT